jgi:hypothetical protein
MSEPDIEAQIQELLDQASYLGPSYARLALYEEAVRLSDLTNDVKRQFRLRKTLIDAAVVCSRHDLALVVFSWCWAKSQALPEQFPPVDLLWEYKWIIGVCWKFPNVSNDEIERHFQAMEQAYREHGSTLNMIYNVRMNGEMYCGHMDRATEYYEQFLASERDRWSDCQACERNTLIEYFSLLGDDQSAVDTAKDLLNGRYSCRSVPESTYANLLLPLLRLRQPERALEMHLKGYAKIKRRPGYAAHAALHLQFLALTGNWSEGWKIFKKYLAEGWNMTVPWPRYEFLRDAMFFLNNYPPRSGRPPSMRVPAEMKLGEANQLVPLPQIAETFTAQARVLAEQFDRRNGNRTQQDLLDKQPELWQLAVDLPLPGSSAKGAKKSSSIRAQDE